MPSAGRKSRVLVVDDEPSIRLLVQRALELHGFEVGVAADGEEALRKLDESTFDLIILDLMMPRLDGFDVIEKLDGRSAPPKVLIMTAASPSVLRELPEERVKSILAKPFEIHDLVRSAIEATRRDAE